MNTFQVLRVFHLLAVSLYAGASFVNGLQEFRALRSGDTGTLLAALRFAELNNRVFLIPATLVLPVTGIWMAQLQHLPLFSGWLVVPLLVFAALTLILVASVWLERRLSELAEQALSEARPPDARFFALVRVAGVAGSTASLMILAMFVLMVLRRPLL